jgi:hypothetical protein
MGYITHTHLPPFRLEDFDLKAKIDLIKIAFPQEIRTYSDALKFEEDFKSIKGGRLNCSKKHGATITIHDATPAGLQYLIDNHPDVEIVDLEIAVDFFLNDGTNDPARLLAAHRYLTINVLPTFPERTGQTVRRIKRHHYVKGKIIPDTMKTQSVGTTTYWSDGRSQVKAYHKTLDNKKPVIGQHSTRIEATLGRGGCQLAGVSHVCQLPDFAKDIRRHLSPFFKVAAGIKPEVPRSRTKTPAKIEKAAHEVAKKRSKAARDYQRYGAASAAKSGRKIVIDRDLSNAIGGALKTLRGQLIRLQLPEKSAELLERCKAQTLMGTEVLISRGPLYIEGASSLPAEQTPSTAPGTPYQTQEGAARLPPSGGAAPSDGIPHQDDNDSWRTEIAALTLPPPALTENTTDL